MIWLFIVGLGAIGLAWVKIRRRRKADELPASHGA